METSQIRLSGWSQKAKDIGAGVSIRDLYASPLNPAENIILTTLINGNQERSNASGALRKGRFLE